MNRKMNINLMFWRVGSFLLLFVFAFGSVGASSPIVADPQSTNSRVISQYQSAQANPELSEEDKIKAAIDAYFTLRYEGQKLLQAQDFSPLLDDDTQAWVKKEKDKRDIELYVATLFDLRYTSYKYMLFYDSVAIDNNQATVLLRESHEVFFHADPLEPARMSDLPHILTLHNKKGAWVVYKDDYQDELSKEMDTVTKEDIKKLVDENYQEDLLRKSSPSRNSSSYSVGAKVLARLSAHPLALTTYSYSRSSAVTYADTYWSTYNTTYYVTLTEDCTNFVSQAIYAGEGKSPTDTSGMGIGGNSNTDWFYVWNNSGSAPWVGTPQQYTFITGNTNQIGPYGGLGTFYDTGLGDIAQIKQGSSYDHEGIITVLGPDLTSEKVNAHTTNRWHYPLSNWSTFSLRYIIVQGWRGN